MYYNIHSFIVHLTTSAVQIYHVPEQAHGVMSSYTGGEVSVCDTFSDGSLSDSLSL